MAAKKISLKVPTAIEVGNVDVEFEVRDGAALMGTVTISRGGIDWRGSGRRSAVSVSWKAFAELMTEQSTASGPTSRGKTGRATRAARTVAPTRTTTARTQNRAGTDAPAAVIRAWAQANGYDVNARGAVSAALREAYQAANPS